MVVDDADGDTFFGLAKEDVRKAVEYVVCPEDIGLQVDVFLGLLQVCEESFVHVRSPGIDIKGLELEERAVRVALDELDESLVFFCGLPLLQQMLRERESLRLEHESPIEAAVDAIQALLVLAEDDIYHDPKDGNEPDDEDPCRGLERIAVLTEYRPDDP